MDTARLRRIIIAAVQTAIGLGVLVWLLLSGAIDWHSLKRLLSVAWVLPTAACLCLVNYAFMAWRLRVLMQAQDLPLPFAAAYRVTVTAAFFSWVIPGGTGGDLVKMYFLGRWYPGKITEAITITLWDRAIGLATFLMLGLIAAAFMPSLATSQPAIASLLITCAAVLLIGGVTLAMALYTDWTQRWPLVTLERFGRPGQTVLRMFRVMHAYRHRLGSLVGGVVLSLCAQGCLLATAYAIATVVVDGGARPTMLVVLPIGWVANALPLSPGGLGVGEAAQEQLFKLIGLSGGAAVSISWRAVAIVMSLPGIWFYFRGRHAVASVPPARQAPRESGSAPPPPQESTTSSTVTRPDHRNSPAASRVLSRTP